MGKIRVQDLARMMGLPNQDLVFKLKSIGVRVEGDDAHIDTDTLQAIVQGKKLPHPREVILRDEEAKATAPKGPRRGPVPRRTPPNPLRPSRRTLIQKVDSSIRTIPVSEAKKERERKAREEAKAAEARAAAEKAAQKRVEAEAQAAAAAQAEEEAAAEAAQAQAQAAEEPAKAADPKAKTETAAAKPAAKADEDKPKADKKRKSKAVDKAEKQEERGDKGKKKARRRDDEDLTSYRGSLDDLDDDDGASRGQRRAERRQKRRQQAQQDGLALGDHVSEGPIMISEQMTVRDFADKLGIKAKDLITHLFKKGMMVNINHVLDPEQAIQLAEEMGVEAMAVSFEEEVQLEQELAAGEESGPRAPRAPVVTVMGHVDHGKTSLLDAIREAKVAEGESGGITQHIGAYRVELGGRPIVFLDTPGHEAFTTMRARGAKVTDLVVLVVAADDGVMPQTIEAIDHARAAKVPLVVAINKIDKANANPDRVKKELADHELLVEEWGGDVVSVAVSALKKEGIDELLEMILLTAELLELQASPSVAAQGAVLEARKEVGRGTVATVLIQNGTLEVGHVFVAGASSGRVRAMLNDRGERLEKAGPATPVEVTGFSDVPAAGDLFQVVKDEAKAREVAAFRQAEQRRKELQPTTGKVSLEQLFNKIEQGEVKELNVIIKADVQGSVEVLRDTLTKLSTEKVRVETIHSAVGAITTNDVLLASASEAIIVGFNVRPEKNATELAEKEEVDIRLHTVIYELTDEIRNAMVGLLEPTYEEVTRGRAEVRETFKVPKAGTVAGCHVVDGVIPRNAEVRLLRDNVVVYTGKISSLRRFKDDVAEVRAGFDCGISLERFQDVKPGDEIEAFVREEVAQTL